MQLYLGCCDNEVTSLKKIKPVLEMPFFKSDSTTDQIKVWINNHKYFSSDYSSTNELEALKDNLKVRKKDTTDSISVSRRTRSKLG
jgi:hypothetical protein